jgi:biopolymer transport protein TolQ
MTVLTILALSAAPTRLNPVALFLQADIVVQSVIVGLVLASIWVWMQIIAVVWRMGRLRRRSDSFEREFWQGGDTEGLLAGKLGASPSARVAQAGPSATRPR